MLVTNHVFLGRIIGHALRDHPVDAFVAGVVSHFAMDACPHWAPPYGAPGSHEQFLRVARIDGVIGLAAMAICVASAPRTARAAVLAAMVGAAVVDADKPCIHFFGRNPFPGWLQRFHSGIQREAPHRLPQELRSALALAALGAVYAIAARRP